MPVLETTAGTKILVSLGVFSLFAGLEPYIPFVIGGLALFSYMVSHNEIKFSIMNAVIIITGAMLIGYLTKGFMHPLSEALHGILLGLLPVEVIEKSKTLKEGHAIESLSNTFSFIAGALSRNIHNKFFQHRDAIINIAIRKGVKKDD